jgi:hypothetical protein
MGIVVTIIMLLGLLLRWPIPFIHQRLEASAPLSANIIGGMLLLGGLWNSLWFGLQHLDVFWGLAALVSGIVMLAVALMVFAERGSQFIQLNVVIKNINSVITPFSLLINISLLACFLLYAVTLIQLNLGMPIIQ